PTRRSSDLVNGSSPLDVEQNSLLPQPRFLKPINELDKTRLPSPEVLFISELNKSSTAATSCASRTTGLDLEGVCDRRTDWVEPEGTALVDENDEDDIEIVCIHDDTVETCPPQIASGHARLERGSQITEISVSCPMR